MFYDINEICVDFIYTMCQKTPRKLRAVFVELNLLAAFTAKNLKSGQIMTLVSKTLTVIYYLFFQILIIYVQLEEYFKGLH